MPYFNLKLSHTDNGLANFAKAFASPVRVAIFRTLLTNGNLVSRDNLSVIPFDHETINKHLADLKRLGFIKAQGARGSIKYSIDEQLFSQMEGEFTMLFESIRLFEPNKKE